VKEIISYEGQAPTPKRQQFDEAFRRQPLRSKRVKGATRGEFIDYQRELSQRGPREVHSDGFLAVTHPARTCPQRGCGGCATHSDGFLCPRCGQYVGEMAHFDGKTQ